MTEGSADEVAEGSGSVGGVAEGSEGGVAEGSVGGVAEEPVGRVAEGAGVVVGRGSSLELLALHAVRLKGMADDKVVAERFGLDQVIASELLLDFQAYGWISESSFAGTGGWSLSDAGRAENERQLAGELEEVGGRESVHATYGEFLALNGRLQQACTDWQIRPTADDALAFNDHSDSGWDIKVIEELATLAEALEKISDQLDAVLDRFRGYNTRFTTAQDRVLAGDISWVDRTAADSCHTVWFELHEDLIATLGLTR